MGKRVRRSSVCLQHQKDNPLEDRISQLPDGILIHILSLLTTREAGRSSVLSHRWRDLWKWTTGLNFDASERGLKLHGKILERERSKFVTWVNQVLKLHHRSSLDEFRVSCNLNFSASRDIEEWMKFVIPKRVKRLEIDLKSYAGRRYTPSQDCYLFFKSPSNLSSIKCLTSLSLKDVHVHGELLEYFLSNCLHLECLSVVYSENLVNLKVAGSSLQLKHLEIFCCNHLESLEVCAPKLMTLKYFGQRIRWRIGSLPHLVELNIAGGKGHQVTYALMSFSNHLSQLETLELGIFLEDNQETPQVPELTNLKHLRLKIAVKFEKSLLGYTYLIEAAPSLLKFTLQLMLFIPLMVRVPKTLIHPHQCLKRVEIFGFRGGTTDLELAMYLLQNAINLENIVIDLYCPSELYRKENKKELQTARKRAHLLEEKLPPGAKLTVL